MICQTANEHLDQLNARAQAIRAQADELGDHALPVPGRPYALRAGDEIQIRLPLDHPQLGRIPNGTTGHVLDVNDSQDEAILRLADGRQARFTQAQAEQASVRLAYVQHPFPAQGHTTDTTHLLVAQHATQVLTDTLDGDGDAIVVGDRGVERPNDQRVGSGNGWQ